MKQITVAAQGVEIANGVNGDGSLELQLSYSASSSLKAMVLRDGSDVTSEVNSRLVWSKSSDGVTWQNTGTTGASLASVDTA